jgi:hypothetical protein
VVVVMSGGPKETDKVAVQMLKERTLPVSTRSIQILKFDGQTGLIILTVLPPVWQGAQLKT